MRQRRSTDPSLKLREKFRIRTYLALKCSRKSQTTKELLAIATDLFRKWIEFQFTNSEMSMSKLNHGKYWNLDNTIPVLLFDMIDKEQQLKAFNWINVCPVEVMRNIQKCNKLDP
jgi:hypothetical protein